jgi:hypothetical protein
MGIVQGGLRRGVFKELHITWGGEGSTAHSDGGARIWMQEWLRDGAGYVDGHAFAERIDQADLILNRATVTLRNRTASRQEEADEEQ